MIDKEILFQMRKVFLSYFREDVRKVRAFKLLLDQAGIASWFDEENIPSGAVWEQEIASNINAASSFVFFISNQFYARPESYVHKEVELAIRRAATMHKSVRWIFPILLDSSKIPDIAIIEDRKLSDYQATRLGWRVDHNARKCIEAITQTIEHPQINRLNLFIRSGKTTEDMNAQMCVLIDGQILLKNGAFISKDDYVRAIEADKGKQSLKGEVLWLSEESECVVHCAPGARSVQLMVLNYRPVDPSIALGPIGVVASALRRLADAHEWTMLESNCLDIEGNAGDRITLHISQTIRRGLLWRLPGPVNEPMYLVRLAP